MNQLYVYICVSDKPLQSCLIVWDPMDCSLPGSSVHGILQARMLEWVAVPSSRESSWPKYWTCVSYISCIDKWDSLPLAPHSKLIKNNKMVLFIFYSQDQVQCIGYIHLYLAYKLIEIENRMMTAMGCGGWWGRLEDVDQRVHTSSHKYSTVIMVNTVLYTWKLLRE